MKKILLFYIISLINTFGMCQSIHVYLLSDLESLERQLNVPRRFDEIIIDPIISKNFNQVSFFDSLYKSNKNIFSDHSYFIFVDNISNFLFTSTLSYDIELENFTAYNLSGEFYNKEQNIDLAAKKIDSILLNILDQTQGNKNITIDLFDEDILYSKFLLTEWIYYYSNYAIKDYCNAMNFLSLIHKNYRDEGFTYLAKGKILIQSVNDAWNIRGEKKYEDKLVFELAYYKLIKAMEYIEYKEEAEELIKSITPMLPSPEFQIPGSKIVSNLYDFISCE
jgi:hypothetical protein